MSFVPFYLFVFMDCIRYMVTGDGITLSQVAYVILEVTIEKYKERLSITEHTNEASKFYLKMLSDLKNRKLKNVIFFYSGELSIFNEALSVVYTQT